MMLRSRILPLVAVPLPLLLTSCPEQPIPPPPAPPAVTVAHPVKEKVMEWDEFTGRLDAAESVNLYSQVTGYLQSVNFKDGAEVRKGDILFQLDARPFQAVLNQAQAQVEQASIKLELARNEFNRAKSLLDSKAISAEDFDQKSKAVREAEAGLRVAQATADKAKLDVEYTTIKAPMDGRLGRRLMDVGGLVIGGPMGATVLANIVSLDPIYCYLDADELTVLRYQRLNRNPSDPNTKENEFPAEMALADDVGFPYKGVVDFVDNRLNPSTGTIQVRVVIPNPKPERGQRPLQPGYFARVRCPGRGEYEALLVDDKAVGSDQAQRVVMVVDDKNVVMPRTVTVGRVINGKRVIRDGLTESDRVVVNGMAKVHPGMTVNPMTEKEVADASKAPTPHGPAAH